MGKSFKILIKSKRRACNVSYDYFHRIVLSVAVPLAAYLKMGKKHGKGLLAANVISFFSVVLVATVCAFSPSPVFADAAPSAAAAAADNGMAYLAAALVTGLACIGAGIAVAAAGQAPRSAQSAKTTKLMGKALIFVALAEGIALYGLLVTFMILGRI